MVLYLTAGFLAGIIASLLTKPVDNKKLENFYALIRTPVTPGERILAPCTLPNDALAPPRKNLFARTSLEIMIPSASSVLGFLAGTGFVALMIGLIFLLLQT